VVLSDRQSFCGKGGFIFALPTKTTASGEWEQDYQEIQASKDLIWLENLANAKAKSFIVSLLAHRLDLKGQKYYNNCTEKIED